MSIFNSQAFLKNVSAASQTVGTLTLGVGDSAPIWDTQSKSVNSTAWANFAEVRDNHDTHTFPLIRDGHLIVSQDSIDLDWEQSLAVLSAMYTHYEKNNDVSQLLSVGAAQRVWVDDKRDQRGNLLFVEEKRLGGELEVSTFNLADKTTWYGDAVYVTNQSAVDDGSGLAWTLPHSHLIDLNHGKVWNEEKIAQQESHGYAVKVYVDGIEVAQKDIYSDQVSYDYTLDYTTGVITFESSQAGKTVTADYAYATTSTWYLRPKEGKVVNILNSEVQFSVDLEFTDAVDMEYWAYNPNDLPNKMMVGKRSYRSVSDFIDEARGTYPAIDAIGTGPLGTPVKMVGFPFNYNTVKQLTHSQGVELRIKTRNGRPFNGFRATATFYCTVDDE